MPDTLGKGKISKGGGVFKKGGMRPLCSLCHLPQFITRRQDTYSESLQLVGSLIADGTMKKVMKPVSW